MKILGPLKNFRKSAKYQIYQQFYIYIFVAKLLFANKYPNVKS